jgi:hypothetical protein
MDSFNAYVALAVAALNEVSGSTWIQWAQGSAVLGAVLVTAVLTWVVRDLWERVDFLWHGAVDRSDLSAVEERVTMLEMGLSQTRSKVARHEEMLAHMQRMREAKAAKKAKVA